MTADTAYKCGVYAITHKESGRKYIGSSNRVHVHLVVHRGELRRNKHGNDRLQKYWNKYGELAFEFSHILICSKENKLFYAQSIIDGYKSADKAIGFNISTKVNSPMHDRATVEEIRVANKGKPSKRKGVPHSAASKEKMRQSMLSLYKTPDFLVQHNARKPTECKRGHLYSGENLYTASDGERGCRSCMRIRSKKWKIKNREKYLADKRAYHQRKKSKT